jgi:ribose/xylose/arabinose/galactoside ABC-type transport system permease subunit
MKLKVNYKEMGITFALILLWILFYMSNESFRHIDSYLSILREASFVGITAIGMTFCIISGNFDLSVGSMLALLSMVAMSNISTIGFIPTVIIVLVLGALLGMINGLIVSKLKIPAFIATLATYFVFRAVAYIYSGGNSVQFQEKWFTSIGNGSIAGIPTPFILLIVLMIAGTVLLRKTAFGRYTLAIGNSEKASIVSGINISRMKVLIFMTVGVFTAISAIVISSRLWSANPGMKDGYEFDVIAAVVLGGTTLAGGKGSVFNTFVASIFFASLNTAMNMFHVDSYMQRVVIGVVLLFAFSITGIRNYIEDFNRRRKSQAVRT